MPDLIFEIGTEEIPAGYIPPALTALSKNLAEFFEKNRLQAGAPQTMGTPRRLVVYVPDIEARQKDVEETHFGPSKEIAFDPDGKPTKAATGFAKSKGVPVDLLTTTKNPKGIISVSVKLKLKGQPTADILNAYLPELIKDLPFPKKMRWSDRSLGFARPIHWIATVFDGKPLVFEFEGIANGDTSYGHRFLKPQAFRFDSLKTYLKKCDSHFVMVDPEARRTQIKEQVQALAKAVGGTVEEDRKLLDTVVHLVEYPVAIRGEFDKKYLALPAELLVITMKHHQKYFPVWADGKLLPYFITISNMKADGPEIQQGNQRVLKARLEDARFFYDADKKRKLEDFVESLQGVVFQKDLGTSYEKVERIVALVVDLGNRWCPEDVKIAERAARLCKADLNSQMVYEFPELQGVMGGYYARHAGEEEAVALAIQEHYQPAFAGEAPPVTRPGALVALADKLDTIVGCISVGLIPSGSEDPYALRRHALGIIQIVLAHGWQADFDRMITSAIEAVAQKAKLSQEEVRRHTLDLFSQRLKFLLTGEDYPYDVIDAVLSTGIDTFKNVRNKVAALSDMKQQPYFETLATAFKRVVSILTDDVTTAVDPKLLKEPAEKALHAKYLEIRSPVQNFVNQHDYALALATIVEIKDSVDAFFDTVMVNVEDAALQKNRMALLYSISQLFTPLADFSRIVLKKS